MFIIIQFIFGIQVYQSNDYISPVLKFFREGGTWTLTKMFKQNSKMGQKVDMVKVQDNKSPQSERLFKKDV